MTKQFTTDEVNTLITDRLARDRNKRASELATMRQQLVKYSAEAQALRDEIANLRLEKRVAENTARTHQATIERRNQTIQALRVQLTERGIS